MRVVIYNAAGRLVRELHNEASPRLTWDGADATGRVVAAGVYTVVVDDGRDRTVRKIVRIH
jgi:flagellar hook assembly protein FlgD